MADDDRRQMERWIEDLTTHPVAKVDRAEAIRRAKLRYEHETHTRLEVIA